MHKRTVRELRKQYADVFGEATNASNKDWLTLAPPPIHTWPRLPPDHPHHVPPGYSAPDNLPPGHPGEYYPDMPPDPVVNPVDEDTGSIGDESQA
ncbi:MAG: hypothetical protein AAFX06_13285 [Planctomycetota bacterium]